MTDRDTLLAACLAAPLDDAPRLIFADWLQEHGEFNELAWQALRGPGEWQTTGGEDLVWDANLRDVLERMFGGLGGLWMDVRPTVRVPFGKARPEIVRCAADGCGGRQFLRTVPDTGEIRCYTHWWHGINEGTLVSSMSCTYTGPDTSLSMPWPIRPISASVMYPSSGVIAAGDYVSFAGAGSVRRTQLGEVYCGVALSAPDETGRVRVRLI